MERAVMNSLLEWREKKNRKPLIIQGARQVGKTHLLKEFGKRHFEKYHYINFENKSVLSEVFEKTLDPASIISEIEFHLETKIDKDKDIIIFDEIQREPRALTSLKYFCEEMPEIAVCAAGSLLGVTMNIDSFPVGKVDMLELRPLNFSEFLIATEDKMVSDFLNGYDLTKPLPVIIHQKLMEIWKHYLIVGGLPEAVEHYRTHRNDLFSAFSKVREIQEVLLKTYMADIAKHSGKINSIHIEQVFMSVPAQLAKSVDESAKRFIFKDVVKGINGYNRLSNPIGWLERADLILRVPVIEHVEIPLIAQVKPNIFKLYFFDVGLLGAISELTPLQILRFDFTTYKGFFTENFVLQELISSGITRTYCWQGRTSEIEFLLQTNAGDIIPVEVKSGAVTQSKSLSVYNERYSPSFSIVVSAKNEGRQPKRWYVPVYAAGKLTRLMKF